MHLKEGRTLLESSPRAPGNRSSSEKTWVPGLGSACHEGLKVARQKLALKTTDWVVLGEIIP